jgi:hypothetical protein
MHAAVSVTAVHVSLLETPSAPRIIAAKYRTAPIYLLSKAHMMVKQEPIKRGHG